MGRKRKDTTTPAKAKATGWNLSPARLHKRLESIKVRKLALEVEAELLLAEEARIAEALEMLRQVQAKLAPAAESEPAPAMAPATDDDAA